MTDAPTIEQPAPQADAEQPPADPPAAPPQQAAEQPDGPTVEQLTQVLKQFGLTDELIAASVAAAPAIEDGTQPGCPVRRPATRRRSSTPASFLRASSFRPKRRRK